MSAKLGWMLLAGLPFIPASIDGAVDLPGSAAHAQAPGRIAVWVDRDEPYQRGASARVYLDASQPSHVAVFRVDTDGRIRTLFPREPWGDTYVRGARRFELTGTRGGRSFVVDDDPGVGYLFAVASGRPFDFSDLTRGDHWDYRLIEGGRIRGDPYVVLADLAARIAPGGKYDYDISPYHVERRYEYPRFVCYDCHAYAKFDEWDPYRRACARFRVVIYDDPRYYPYRSASGRNVVMRRPARPGPRFVFRDVDPVSDYVTRVKGRSSEEHRPGDARARTSKDIGGRGSVAAPGTTAPPAPRMAPPLKAVPSRPPGEDRRPAARARPQVGEEPTTRAAPEGLRPTDRGKMKPADDGKRLAPAAKPQPAAKPGKEPRSTGEPELRRRKP
jgi:hypothetical protein